MMLREWIRRTLLRRPQRLYPKTNTDIAAERDYIWDCCAAQALLCAEEGREHLCPSGYCPRCNKPIYGKPHGYMLDGARTIYVHRCPHCQWDLQG